MQAQHMQRDGRERERGATAKFYADEHRTRKTGERSEGEQHQQCSKRNSSD